MDRLQITLAKESDDGGLASHSSHVSVTPASLLAQVGEDSSGRKHPISWRSVGLGNFPLNWSSGKFLQNLHGASIEFRVMAKGGA